MFWFSSLILFSPSQSLPKIEVCISSNMRLLVASTLSCLIKWTFMNSFPYLRCIKLKNENSMTSLLFLLILFVQVSVFSSFKFKTYAQTAFENSKVNRKVSTSRWREGLRRDRLEVRQKLKYQKSLRELNRDRIIRFESIKNSSSDAIISLYLRRAPFLKFNSKKSSIPQITIYGEWFYYKDILVRGDIVSRMIAQIGNLSSSGGVEEESARMDFEALLRETIASLNSSDSISGRFTVQNAFDELMIMDPKLSSLLTSRNLEFGYSIKQQEKSKSLEDRLLLLNRPIFRLPEKDPRGSDRLMPIEAMDFLRFDSTDRNIFQERKDLLRSTIKDYFNVLLSKQVKHLVLAVDGSALFYDAVSGREVCCSAGILLSPKDETNYRDRSLLFNVYPIRGSLKRPLDAELMALISSICLANQILECFLFHRGAIQENLTIELISDCKSACKVFHDQEKLITSTVSSNQQSINDLTDVLRFKQSQMKAIVQELKKVGCDVQISCQWQRGHPELAEPFPSRWNAEQGYLYIVDKIAGIGFLNGLNELQPGNPAFSLYLNKWCSKDKDLNEFCHLHELSMGEKLSVVHFADLLQLERRED